MGNGNSGSKYHDIDCRSDTKQATHFPALVFNLKTDPSELYPLNRSDNLDIHTDLYKMKVQHEVSMVWRKSQISLGRNVYLHPCINPGCEPFPACCRHDWTAPLLAADAPVFADAQQPSSPVRLNVQAGKKKNKKKKKCLVYANQKEL